MKKYGYLSVIAFAFIASGCGSSSEGAASDVPEYFIAEDGGNQDYTTILIPEPLDESGYRAILEDYKGSQTEDGGYYVSFNCNGEAEEDLASARFGIGSLGAASTGVEDGDFLLELEESAACS